MLTYQLFFFLIVSSNQILNADYVIPAQESLIRTLPVTSRLFNNLYKHKPENL